MTIGQIYLHICGLTKVHMELFGNIKMELYTATTDSSLPNQIYFLKIKDFLPKLGKSHGVNDDGHFCPSSFIII